MHLETHSLVEDGQIVALRKLKIRGEAYELRHLCVCILDAVESGKKKVWVDETEIVIKRKP